MVRTGWRYIINFYHRVKCVHWRGISKLGNWKPTRSLNRRQKTGGALWIDSLNCRKHVMLSEKGVALMMVLWVMALLSIIIAEFAFSMRTELKITGNFKEEVENYYRAQAAIQQAMTEVLSPDISHNYLKDGKLVFATKEEGGEEYQAETEEPDYIPERENISFNNGYFSYKIEDEEGKIYLNRFGADNENNRQILARLLEKGAGMTEGTEMDTIIDSIMDWLDKDDLHKINGAEDDYYQSLSPPYECKDGPFDTVEELLLVKGITPEILFGSGEGENSSGIAQYLTVWGSSRFNPYTADETTIIIMHGEDGAQELELYDEYGEPKQKIRSSNFSIIGKGLSQTGSGQRLIKAVVTVSNKFGAPALRIRFWNDNVLGYSWTSSQTETENFDEDAEYL